jgi:hypothetical protein
MYLIRQSRVLPVSAGVAMLLMAGCAVGPDFKKPAPPAVTDYTVTPLATTAATPDVAGGAAPAIYPVSSSSLPSP